MRIEVEHHHVMTGHNRSKNGVALLAYIPAIHAFLTERPL